MIHKHEIYQIGFYRFRLGEKLYRVLGWGEKYSSSTGIKKIKDFVLVECEIECWKYPPPYIFEPRTPFNMEVNFIRSKAKIYNL